MFVFRVLPLSEAAEQAAKLRETLGLFMKLGPSKIKSLLSGEE